MPRSSHLLDKAALQHDGDVLSHSFSKFCTGVNPKNIISKLGKTIRLGVGEVFRIFSNSVHGYTCFQGVYNVLHMGRTDLLQILV